MSDKPELPPMPDTWWERFVNLHNSYINLHNNHKPNVCVIDEASFDMYMKESQKCALAEQPFKGTFIVVPRCGQSEVRFYYQIMTSYRS